VGNKPESLLTNCIYLLFIAFQAEISAYEAVLLVLLALLAGLVLGFDLFNGR